MNKALSKKAARIAETAKKSGGMFVFATRDSKLVDAPNTSAVLAKFKFSEHACGDCGHTFQAVAAAGLQYHCNSCGSGSTTAKTEVSKLDIPVDDKLSLITCGSCNTHNIMPGDVVASVSQMNCAACGHEMNYKTAASTTASTEKADADEMPNNDMDPITDVDDMDLVDMDDDDDLVEDDSGDELFDDDVDTTASTEKADAVGLEPVADSGMNGNPIATDPKTEERLKKVQNMTDGNGTSDGAGGGLDREVDMVNVVTERPTPTVGPTDTLTPPAIAFVYLGDSMNVAVGNVIVATLTPELAGENAEMMHQKHFQLAVKHSIDTLGLKEALKTYNFQHATVTVKLGPEIAKLIEDGIAEKSNKVTAALDATAADFQQSLDIAAAGWAQNFWRNRVSPVKAALVSELTAAGLKAGSAEKLVDRVMAAHGVADVREMLAIARELAAKPVEARNGLAQAIDLAKYLPSVVKAESDDKDDDKDAGEDDEDEDNDVVARVATPVSNVDKSDNQVTASHYKTPQLASILGGKSFSS